MHNRARVPAQVAPCNIHTAIYNGRRAEVHIATRNRDVAADFAVQVGVPAKHDHVSRDLRALLDVQSAAEQDEVAVHGCAVAAGPSSAKHDDLSVSVAALTHNIA